MKTAIREGNWWMCSECGAKLPEAPPMPYGKLAECAACGALWRYELRGRVVTPRLLDRGYSDFGANALTVSAGT